MANAIMHSTMLLLLCALLMAIFKTTDAQVGVCYGMMGNNLPPAAEVIDIYKNVSNPRLEYLAASQANADRWVQDNIRRYSTVNFRYVATIGNEVKPQDPFARFLFPAMQNVHKAIVKAGLGNQIKVSTATFFGAMEVSYPPSQGKLRGDYQQLLDVDYALFTAPSVVVTDGPYLYQNLFDAMLDAFYAALERAGGGSLDIVVSESGWPSAGGTDTSVNNAKTYKTNLVRHKNKEPAYEKHWGLFFPSKQEKYPISFN
uniref:glucan endo-1,3-beta-D-glucosidase n=1 Tax=Gossypium raimondii TaxID=29730 RepID=A0A0D2V3I2_GOSRA|nr:hypothetical protein B456_010G003400 [Gossypium raimondii]